MHNKFTAGIFVKCFIAFVIQRMSLTTSGKFCALNLAMLRTLTKWAETSQAAVLKALKNFFCLVCYCCCFFAGKPRSIMRTAEPDWPFYRRAYTHFVACCKHFFFGIKRLRYFDIQCCDEAHCALVVKTFPRQRRNNLKFCDIVPRVGRCFESGWHWDRSPLSAGVAYKQPQLNSGLEVKETSIARRLAATRRLRLVQP